MGPTSKDPPDAVVAATPGSAAGTLKDDAPWLRRALGAALGQITEPAGWTVVLAALLILIVGTGVFISIPTFYNRLDTYFSRLPSIVVNDSVEHAALQVVTARAVLYPLAKGSLALVVRGEVRNQSDQPQSATDAQLQLKDAHGFIVAQSPRALRLCTAFDGCIPPSGRPSVAKSGSTNARHRARPLGTSGHRDVYARCRSAAADIGGHRAGDIPALGGFTGPASLAKTPSRGVAPICGRRSPILGCDACSCPRQRRAWAICGLCLARGAPLARPPSEHRRWVA